MLLKYMLCLVLVLELHVADAGYGGCSVSKPLSSCKCVVNFNCKAYSNSICEKGTCRCKTGFKLVEGGKKCKPEDINECTEGTHTCHKDASCIDTVGSYSCMCNSGYTGDGRTCTSVCSASKPLSGCKCVTDINCKAYSNSKCEKGTCECKPGFNLVDGGKKCEPECEDGKTKLSDCHCGEHSHCPDENTRCMKGECKCKPEFEMFNNGKNCRKSCKGGEVKDCKCKSHADCDFKNSVCTKSGHCLCKEGFTLSTNGKHCITKPKCHVGKTKVSDCHCSSNSECKFAHSECKDGKCACKHGFLLNFPHKKCGKIPKCQDGKSILARCKCTDDSHCTIPNSECSTELNHCHCKFGFALSGHEKKCTKGEIGSHCGRFSHQACDKIKNAECGDNKKCKCKSEFKPDGNGGCKPSGYSG